MGTFAHTLTDVQKEARNVQFYLIPTLIVQ